MGENRTSENKVSIEELLYYTFLGILLFAKGIGLYDGQSVFKCLLVVAVFFWAGKMAAARYSIKEMICIILFLGLGALTYLKSGEKGILLFMMMLTGMKNIPVKRAFYVGLGAWGSAFCILTFTSLFHMADMGYKVHDKLGLGYIFRYGLGYAHPNVLHVSYFILAVFLVYIWNDKYDWKKMLGLMAGNFLVFAYSVSYTGVAIVALYLLTALYAAGRKKLSVLERAACFCVYPFCCLLSLWGSVLLKNHERLFSVINKIVNERLRLSQIFLVRENLSIFGVKVADIITDSVTMDNAYVYLLITHGIVIFILMSAAYMYLVFVYGKENKAKELAIIIFICFMGIMEPYLFNASFKNVIFLYLGELFYRKCAGKGREIGIGPWVRLCEGKILSIKRRGKGLRDGLGRLKRRKKTIGYICVAAGILTAGIYGTVCMMRMPQGYIVPRIQASIIEEEYFYITDDWEKDYPSYQIVGQIEADTPVNGFGGNIVRVETGRRYLNGFVIGSVLSGMILCGFEFCGAMRKKP